jgi:AmiR/NasT family two-component response regulator
LDGLEASSQILERLHTCIVILTAFSEEEDRRHALAIGVCGYVIKPVTGDTLIRPLVVAMEQFSRGSRVQ